MNFLNSYKWLFFRRIYQFICIESFDEFKQKADIASLNVKSRFAEIVASGQLLESTTGFLGLNYSTVNVHPMSGTNDLFTSRTDISSLLINNLKP